MSEQKQQVEGLATMPNPCFMSDTLKEIMTRCKSGVRLDINNHSNSYISVEEILRDAHEDDISVEVRNKILLTNTLIQLWIYPDNPVGHYYIVHYDLEKALLIALECLKNTELTS